MEQTDSKCLVKKIDHMEIATSDIAKLEKLFEGFGFWTTQIRDNAEGLSKLMEQGHTKLLLTEGKAGSFAQSYSANHGDGVCRLAFTVADTVDAYKTAIERGAEGIEDPKVEKAKFEGADIELSTASIKSFGDVRATFMKREAGDVDAGLNTRPFAPGFTITDAASKGNSNSAGLLSVDHLTNNVEMGMMDHWSEFYSRVYGFVETRYFDIRAQKTGLHSKVMQTPSGSVKIPINEATEEKSQIQEFIVEHKGAGVQHIAMTTKDIIKSVRDLRERGFKFLEVPDTYYEEVKKRIPQIEEDINELQELKILVDGDESGYLDQISTENQIGPLFFELIQRKGNQGFGEGNFKALFEAIERDQERRGVL